MNIYVKIIVTILLLIWSFSMSLTALLKGLSKRKVTSKYTQKEQENDLYNYMVSQCSAMERFSKFLKNSMTKQELSDYKRNQVLGNMKMYAKANSYNWYNEGVWGEVLTKYIDEANTASGKVTTK